MTTPAQTIIGRGIYSVPDAARLSGIPARRIRRWLLGYDFAVQSRRGHTGPAFQHDYPADGRQLWLSFADLVEVRFLDAFLKLGVSWASIRIASERARDILDLDHPFSSRVFKTDGQTILTEIATGTRTAELLDLVRNRIELKKIVAPYLYRGLEFAADERVSRWWPEIGHRKIVLDPARAFGKPIVDKDDVPTRALFDAFAAEKSVERVAEVFEVSRSSVQAAISFEQHLAA